MSNKNAHNSSRKRRDFLKQGLSSLCVAGITYTTIDKARAQEFGLSVGESNFIEVTKYYETQTDLSLGNSDGLPRYFLDQEKDILGLVNNPKIRRFIQNGAIVTNGRILRRLSSKNSESTVLYQGPTSVIDIGDVKYNRADGYGLFLENPIKQSAVEITSGTGDSIRCSVDNKEFAVEPKEEREIMLQPRTAEISVGKIREQRFELRNRKADRKIPSETITVTPKVKIRNNGLVTAFGAEGNYVIPPNTEDSMAQNMIAVRRQAPDVERVQTSMAETNQISNPNLESNDQLFVVQKGGKNGPN